VNLSAIISISCRHSVRIVRGVSHTSEITFLRTVAIMTSNQSISAISFTSLDEKARLIKVHETLNLKRQKITSVVECCKVWDDTVAL